MRPSSARERPLWLFQAQGFVRDGDPDALAATAMLIVQAAVLSAPLVENWLPEDAWAGELAHALAGYLGEDR